LTDVFVVGGDDLGGWKLGRLDIKRFERVGDAEEESDGG
jgi:hypothetical protein